MKRLLVLGLVGIAGASFGQAPDVSIKFDGRINYQTGPNIPNTQRLYDALGHYSIVSLSFKLEPGFRVYVGQKLQRFDGRKDRDLLDEYYIEDEGIWRAGKQYVPFGANRMVRESVLAARGDTNLIFEGLPIAAAYCQGEPGRQEGGVARIGGRLGFSVFYGDHFGIDGTSFCFIRNPNEAPGRHHGYKNAYALDYSKGLGQFNLGFEAIILRHPNDTRDEEFEVGDLSATYTPSKFQTYTLGWSRRTRPTEDFYRGQASIFLTRNVFLESLIRYKGRDLYDFNIGVRVRL